MRIEIHGARSERIKAHVNTKMNGALDPYEGHIDRVEVRLGDVNAAKGGIDKDVLINIHVTRNTPVIVHERNGDMYAAVAQAADRAKTAVGRVMDRKYHRRHAVGWKGMA